jgi:hypothetical protein
MSPAPFLARVLLALLVASGASLAQGGWTTEKHPDLGLTFPRAKDYEQIPTQPDEKHCVLYFAEKVTDKTREKRNVRPELYVLWFDKLPPPPATTGTEVPAPPVAPAQSGAPAQPGDGAKPAKPPPPPVDDLDSFVHRYYPNWRLGKGTEGKERNGFKSREFTFLPGSEIRDPVAGWICSYLKGGRTISFLGFCGEEDVKEQVKIWRYTAEHVDFAEPEEQTTDKLQRMYARLALPRADFRIGVRKKLVRGWKAEDTQHYIVIYDTADQPLVRKIVRDLELLHAEYESLFPPTEKIDAVSTVRICKSSEEYLAYGGDPGTSGYWNSEAQELVLYDAETVDRHVRSDADTFVTLYHEGFHQYIHYSCGGVPPHSWFNEGHGDFFSGAHVKDGKIWSIGVNTWRVAMAKAIVEFQKAIPWKQIVRFEQSEFYDEKRIEICYPQAWSMIYFLRKSKVVEKRPEWARILPTYFAKLREAYAAEMEILKTAGKEGDRKSAARAGVESRKKAVEAAFEGVDIEELQAAWENFVRDLEIPKRG